MFDRSMPIPLASLCALVCITAPSLRAGDDPKEILRRALNVNSHSHELALAYTYVERDEQRTLDKAGAVAQRKSTTWDVIPLREESHYRRLIQRDDKPLSPKEEQQQAAARQKQEAERQRIKASRDAQTPEQRKKRLDAKEHARQREQREIDDVVDGLDLRLAGEERIDGVPVWDRGCTAARLQVPVRRFGPRPRQDEGPRLDRERRLSAGQNRRGNHRQHLIWRGSRTPQQRHAGSDRKSVGWGKRGELGARR